MSIRCRLGFHDWSQDCGRCARCGSKRSPIHSWQGEVCSVCGASLMQLVDLLWGEIWKALPAVPVHHDRCKEFLAQSLKGGESPESAAKHLVKAFKKDKGTLIDHDERIRSLAGSIFVQMRQAMPGITLLESGCNDILTEELKAGKSPERAVKRLVKNMKDNPRRYMILPSPPRSDRCFDSCRSCRGCCP